jgi:hypothetical protein
VFLWYSVSIRGEVCLFLEIYMVYSASIGSWRCYINTAITILDIIHRPIFYLKLNLTQQVCTALTGNTLRLRYKPSRLLLSIGLWRRYINITITVLDIILRSVFYLKTPFYRVDSVFFRRRQRLAPSSGPNWVGSSWRRRKNLNRVVNKMSLKIRRGQ